MKDGKDPSTSNVVQSEGSPSTTATVVAATQTGYDRFSSRNSGDISPKSGTIDAEMDVDTNKRREENEWSVNNNSNSNSGMDGSAVKSKKRDRSSTGSDTSSAPQSILKTAPSKRGRISFSDNIVDFVNFEKEDAPVKISFTLNRAPKNYNPVNGDDDNSNDPEKLKKKRKKIILFPCLSCKRKFLNNEALQKHIAVSPFHKRNTSDPSLRIECLTCQRRFNSLEELDLHLKKSIMHARNSIMQKYKDITV